LPSRLFHFDDDNSTGVIAPPKGLEKEVGRMNTATPMIVSMSKRFRFNHPIMGLSQRDKKMVHPADADDFVTAVGSHATKS
jgi:hypothetical protein